MVKAYQIAASKVRVVAKSLIAFDPSIIRMCTNIYDELSDLIEEAGENAATPSSADEVDDSLGDNLKRHHKE